MGLPSKIVKTGKVIWVHAVSLGETKAVIPLLRKILFKYPNTQIVFSSITVTGHEEAKKSLPKASLHFFLPLDFSWIMKKVVQRIKPDLLILVETDFWFNLMNEVKKSGALVAVVNGKISLRSFKRFRFASLFSKRLFSLIDCFCLQNELYLKRFLELSIDPKKLFVTGNLKFDTSSSLEPRKATHDLTLLIASTHRGEEEALLPILKKLWETYPDLKVFLAPRHPERFSEVEKLLIHNNISFTRSSQAQPHSNILLIDAMGQLDSFFSISDLAIIGGSFTGKVGGHNILEPLKVGIPVLFGPSMFAQEELVHLVLKAKAGIQTPLSQLSTHLTHLLASKSERKAMGEAGLRLVQDLKGSLNRTLEKLETNCPF